VAVTEEPPTELAGTLAFVASPSPVLDTTCGMRLARPGAVPGDLRVSRAPGGVSLSWSAAPDAESHDLFSGGLPIAPVGATPGPQAGGCRLAEPSFFAATEAGDGSTYYLARGRNELGPGPLGEDSFGRATEPAVSCP